MESKIEWDDTKEEVMGEFEVEEKADGMFTLDKTDEQHLFLFTFWRDFFPGKELWDTVP